MENLETNTLENQFTSEVSEARKKRLREKLGEATMYAMHFGITASAMYAGQRIGLEIATPMIDHEISPNLPVVLASSSAYVAALRHGGIIGKSNKRSRETTASEQNSIESPLEG